MDGLEEEKGPEDVEELEGAEEPVEDVVGGEHLDKVAGVDEGGVEDPVGIDATPGDYPGDGEQDEDSVAGSLVSGVAEHLGQLEQVVGAVVDDEDEAADPVGVGRPGEHHQGDGGVVVDEHLPEVLPPHVKELTEAATCFTFF